MFVHIGCELVCVLACLTGRVDYLRIFTVLKKKTTPDANVSENAPADNQTICLLFPPRADRGGLVHQAKILPGRKPSGRNFQ